MHVTGTDLKPPGPHQRAGPRWRWPLYLGELVCNEQNGSVWRAQGLICRGPCRGTWAFVTCVLLGRAAKEAGKRERKEESFRAYCPGAALAVQGKSRLPDQSSVWPARRLGPTGASALRRTPVRAWPVRCPGGEKPTGI